VNRREKAVVIKIVFVTTITIILVVTFANFKDIVNRSEAMRAFKAVGENVLQYRKTHGHLPPQSYVDEVRKGLEGSVRLGKLNYRALYITIGAKPDEIVLYTGKNYKSLFVSNGYIVLRLDGQVEWVDVQSFEEELMRRKSLLESPNFIKK